MPFLVGLRVVESEKLHNIHAFDRYLCKFVDIVTIHIILVLDHPSFFKEEFVNFHHKCQEVPTSVMLTFCKDFLAPFISLIVGI
jgi:hypothetical protein